MKSIAWIFLLSVLSFTSRAQLSIDINYNVELLGLAYFIGFEGVDIEKKTITIEGREIPKKEWHSYGYRIYQQYKKYAASENLAKSFTVADHLWLDYIINLLIQLDEFPNARLNPGVHQKYYIHFSRTKDTAEARKNVTIFLDGLNKFYEEVNFKQYIIDTRPLYASVIAQVKANSPSPAFIEVMENFYRKKFDHYALLPSLTIPKGMGFGLNYSRNGKTFLFNSFGAFNFQNFDNPANPDPGFNNPQRLRELSIHEFGHSFVNPAVDSVPEEKIIKTQILFEPIKQKMNDQGYNTWKACLYEHFVRSGEVVIATLMGDQNTARRLQTAYTENRSFIYLPMIATELETYNKGQETYATAVARIIDQLLQLSYKPTHSALKEHRHTGNVAPGSASLPRDHKPHDYLHSILPLLHE